MAHKSAVASGALPADDSQLRQRATLADPRSSIPVTPVEIDDKKKAPAPTSIWKILDQWEVFYAPIVFTAIALFTRLYKIGLSNIVTWDEAQQVFPSSSYLLYTGGMVLAHAGRV